MIIKVKVLKIIKIIVYLLAILSILIILFSCKNSYNKNLILNIDSKKIHRVTCPTVKNMKNENKIATNSNILVLVGLGYSCCKDCKPENLFSHNIINIDDARKISNFKKVLHDEFNFGIDYDDKILTMLSDLYIGILSFYANNYESTIEYHVSLASVVYHNRKTWSKIANLYENMTDTKRKIYKYTMNSGVDDNYKNDENINSICQEIYKQHESKSNQNDFAHMSASIATRACESAYKILAGVYAQRFNGILDINAEAGYIGDLCGVNGSRPSMNEDDYAADLDAVNLYFRYINNKDASIYDTFTNYYFELFENSNNRAKEFKQNITMKRLKQYRNDYLNFLTVEYSNNSLEIINRLNYYDNFYYHIEHEDQNFMHCKYTQYNLY